MVSRGFGFYSTLIGMALMLVGMTVGINQSTTTNSGLYGVIIIYLFGFTDLFQWVLRQIVTS
jgi:F0F1-type ATP synthase assembly protein I